MKHAPGPHRNGMHYAAMVSKNKEADPIFVCSDCHSDSDGNCVVLCPLHAAAPELLEALRGLFAATMNIGVSGPFADNLREWQVIANSAIRKAEGGD